MSLNWSLHFIISKAMLWKNWWKRGEVTRIMYNEILQFHSSFWIVSFLDTGYFLYMHEILQGIFLSIGCDRFKFTIMGLFFCHTYLCDNNLYYQTKKSWTKFFYCFGWLNIYCGGPCTCGICFENMWNNNTLKQNSMLLLNELNS